VKLPVEAAMIWNEPNNKSHWDPELDPDWERFSTLVTEAGKAIRSVNPGLKRVLGGMSPIDPFWVEKLKPRGVLDHVEVVAVHGFPLDWNLWPIHEWPDRIAEIEAVAPDHESGRPKSASAASGRRKSRCSESTKPRSCCSGACRASSGIRCSTCRKAGKPRRATSRRKAPPTIATSTWA
jgi:hypothetical protein